MASNLGLGLSYALMAWAPTLSLLFIGRAISGVTGASFGTASAYIADTTPLDKRAGAFGILGRRVPGWGSFLARPSADFWAGPLIEHSFNLGRFSAHLPLWVAAAFSLINALYGFFVLPESLPRSLRTKFRWRRANPVGSLKLLRRHPDLLALAAVLFLSTLSQVSLPSTVTLYAMFRYRWTPDTIGLTLALVGIAMVLVAGGRRRPRGEAVRQPRDPDRGIMLRARRDFAMPVSRRRDRSSSGAYPSSPSGASSAPPVRR